MVASQSTVAELCTKSNSLGVYLGRKRKKKRKKKTRNKQFTKVNGTKK